MLAVTVALKAKSCRYMMFSLHNLCCIAPRLTLFHSNLFNTPIDEIFVKWIGRGATQHHKLLGENIMYRHDLAFDATVTANIFQRSWRQKDYKFQT